MVNSDQVEVNNEANNDEALQDANHDPYFAPIVKLPEVDVPTGEDGEDELFKMRAKLFRFDSNAEPPEWKERGTGDVRLLQNKGKPGKIRVLMRRDKTLRICANHFIQPWMLLRPMKGSDRAWMWLVRADFADEEAKPETLAIRFANAENAKKFKDAFDNAVLAVIEKEADKITKAEEPAEKNENDSKEEEEKSQEVKDDAEKETSDQLSALSIKANE